MMDKQRQSITVSINGQPRPFTVERQAEESPPQPQRHQSEQRPMTESAEARRRVHEPAAGGQAKEENDRWDGPVIGSAFPADRLEAAALEADEAVRPVSELFSSKKATRPKRRPPSFLKPWLIAAALAAFVGIAFGMMVLRIIPKDKLEPSPAAEAMVELTAPERATGAAGGDRAPFSIAVMQAGVYSNVAAAKRAAEPIRAAGAPAVVVGQKPAAIYIAVGADKETLRAVNNNYRKAVSSTYVKELVFSADANARRLEVVQKGEALYKRMASVSAALLSGRNVSEDDWQALQTTYDAFEKSKMDDGKTATDYIEALKQAYVALAAYKEQRDEALLVKAQQQLLEALATYIEWVPLGS
ncbi:stage II sporulation protein D [Caldibacillus thermoamylovorans]